MRSFLGLLAAVVVTAGLMWAVTGFGHPGQWNLGHPGGLDAPAASTAPVPSEVVAPPSPGRRHGGSASRTRGATPAAAPAAPSAAPVPDAITNELGLPGGTSMELLPARGSAAASAAAFADQVAATLTKLPDVAALEKAGYTRRTPTLWMSERALADGRVLDAAAPEAVIVGRGASMGALFLAASATLPAPPGSPAVQWQRRTLSSSFCVHPDHAFYPRQGGCHAGDARTTVTPPFLLVWHAPGIAPYTPVVAPTEIG